MKPGVWLKIGRIRACVMRVSDGLAKCYVDPDDASKGTFWLSIEECEQFREE